MHCYKIKNNYDAIEKNKSKLSFESPQKKGRFSELSISLVITRTGG